MERHARHEVETMQIDEQTIRRVAHERLAGRSLPMIVLRQAFYENWTRLRTHMSFRSSENQSAREAYSAMSTQEFEGINARQQWANWRTIPRNLNGRLPARPVKAIDLCCGVGHSTEVLSAYLMPGSEIHGLEFNPGFVDQARKRKFRDKTGGLMKVSFFPQSVLETFRDADGAPIPAGSIDLVNSVGAVGHHFDVEASSKVVAEVARVLKSGGLATIDSGPEGTTTEQLIELFAKNGFETLNATKSCFIDSYTQVCARKR